MRFIRMDFRHFDKMEQYASIQLYWLVLLSKSSSVRTNYIIIECILYSLDEKKTHTVKMPVPWSESPAKWKMSRQCAMCMHFGWRVFAARIRFYHSQMTFNTRWFGICIAWIIALQVAIGIAEIQISSGRFDPICITCDFALAKKLRMPSIVAQNFMHWLIPESRCAVFRVRLSFVSHLHFTLCVCAANVCLVHRAQHCRIAMCDVIWGREDAVDVAC